MRQSVFPRKSAIDDIHIEADLSASIAVDSVRVSVRIVLHELHNTRSRFTLTVLYILQCVINIIIL